MKATALDSIVLVARLHWRCQLVYEWPHHAIPWRIVQNQILDNLISTTIDKRYLSSLSRLFESIPQRVEFFAATSEINK
jgi:hypothetical protein